MSEVHDFLAHYGVKGMKWGVSKDHRREFREKDTKDTSTSVVGRKVASVQMLRYMSKGRAIQVSKKYDDEWYDKLETGKQFVEKGHTLNRVVRGVDQNAMAGRLYVSKLQSDSDMYTATIPTFTNGGFAAGKKTYNTAYQVSMETKTRLTMPSPKVRIDTFIDTLQSKDGRQWLSDNGYKGEIDELNAKEVGFKYYERFNKYAGNQSVKYNDTYFNSIKSQGYNALIDDNDAGIWAKEPVILLNPRGTARITKVRQLTAKEINDSQRKVLETRQYQTRRK